MKILSIAVPSYNSEAYMEKCINSLLIGGEDVEILIVDDGSTKDRTAEIADSYERRYPTICRAIHQENKGHGGAVNTGLRNASGMYYKVVDSDDWVDPEAYRKILALLKDSAKTEEPIDMLISNFVYEKEGARHKKVMRYSCALPEGRPFGWEETGRLPKNRQILMHSLIYRTELLRDCGLNLPEHTFYVDNLVAFIPFPYVKKMYYLNVDFYRYYIGRSDQSVNEKIMIGRIDQQLKVNRLMIEYMGRQQELEGRCKNYMLNYLNIIMSVSSVLLIRSDTEENFQKKQELWEYLRENDPQDYRKIRCGLLGLVMNVKTRPALKAVCLLYKLAQKIYGFN